MTIKVCDNNYYSDKNRKSDGHAVSESVLTSFLSAMMASVIYQGLSPSLATMSYIVKWY